jgi:hypothetical protein
MVSRKKGMRAKMRRDDVRRWPDRLSEEPKGARRRKRHSIHHPSAPLDMRMNQSADIPTAADVVNTYSEIDLADIIWNVSFLLSLPTPPVSFLLLVCSPPSLLPLLSCFLTREVLR